MVNYPNSRIYKIEPICDHDDNEIYYGSTSQPLCRRIDKHRTGYKIWKEGKCHKTTVYDLFDKYGVENCKIYLVELFPCNSKEELEAREGYYIRNNPCINKVVVGRTYKQYYDDNKERILENHQQYYNDNKEKLLERYKKYNEDNKERISEKNKAIFNCDCGSCLTHKAKARHYKTLKHQNYLKEKEEQEV